MPPADPALRPPLRGDHATCPFCALLCDDLELRAATDGSFAIARNGCARASADYARTPLAPTPYVGGKETSLAQAVSAAARLLKRARQPLFGGLATDVDGMRAAVDLACRCGAVLDHVHGETLNAMSRILQTRGWYASTLSELRNRADLVLLVGVDLGDRYESLTRRCLRPATTLHEETLAARQVVLLGARAPAGTLPGSETIKCADTDLAPALAALLALVKGQAVTARKAGGVTLKVLDGLAGKLRGARYAAIVFAPGRLSAPREPVLATLCELVDALNREGRAALLPLGGDDGGQTAISTCAWLSGYPLRVTCGQTFDYRPLANATADLLARGEADALLWIDAFGRNGAPPAGADVARTVVLGATCPATARDAAVFIPVGTPGLDHRARLLRTDAVVSLALAPQRTTALPAVATVLRAIEAEV